MTVTEILPDETRHAVLFGEFSKIDLMTRNGRLCQPLVAPVTCTGRQRRREFGITRSRIGDIHRMQSAMTAGAEAPLRSFHPNLAVRWLTHAVTTSSSAPEISTTTRPEENSNMQFQIDKLFVLAVLPLAILSLHTPRFCSADNPELDAYGGWMGLQGQRTGFFHVEKINGRNWFVTPEGNVFFAVALSHMFSGESDVACKNVYEGDRNAWLQGSFERAREMGFNCALGSATSPERNLNGFVDVQKAEELFREHSFPFAVGVILLKHPWEFVDGETLPDIFHPEYERLIESRAAEVCPRYRDDPLCMGYYYGFGAFNRADEWVNHHLSLPPGSPGRTVLVELLIERYSDDVEAFNDVYGTSLQQIADLKTTEQLTYEKAYERRNYPAVRQTLDRAQLDDFEAIVSHMCVTLYQIGFTAVRRWDVNHLILGSFIKEWALSAESTKLAASYVDMIAPQHFNRDISVGDLGMAADLPIIISDEYFGFHYPGGTGSLHAAVASHDARGEIYEANLLRHFKDPQVMGVTYCACMYDQGGETLRKNNQNGFYSIEGEPRPNLIQTVTDINHSVYRHTLTPATPEELEQLNDQLFERWDQHQVRRRRNR